RARHGRRTARRGILLRGSVPGPRRAGRGHRRRRGRHRARIPCAARLLRPVCIVPRRLGGSSQAGTVAKLSRGRAPVRSGALPRVSYSVRMSLRGSGLDTSSGPQFIQQRIALFAQMTAITAFTFFLVGRVLVAALRGQPVRFTQQGQIAHIAGVAIALAAWLACRRGQRSLASLEAIDAVAVVGTCTAWGFFVVQPNLEWIYTALVANTLTVLARAITVPSKAGRTLRLSVLAFVSQLVLVWLWVLRPEERPMPLAMGIDQTIWCAAVVTIATITSRILYDLRRSVREANEL